MNFHLGNRSQLRCEVRIKRGLVVGDRERGARDAVAADAAGDALGRDTVLVGDRDAAGGRPGSRRS